MRWNHWDTTSLCYWCWGCDRPPSFSKSGFLEMNMWFPCLLTTASFCVIIPEWPTVYLSFVPPSNRHRLETCWCCSLALSFICVFSLSCLCNFRQNTRISRELYFSTHSTRGSARAVSALKEAASSEQEVTVWQSPEAKLLLQVSPVINHGCRLILWHYVAGASQVNPEEWMTRRGSERATGGLCGNRFPGSSAGSTRWCMGVGINYWKSNSSRQQWEDLRATTSFMPLNTLPPDM